MPNNIIQQHEQLAAAVSRLVTEYVARLESRKVASNVTPDELVQLFAEPLPETGSDIETIITRYRDEIEPHTMTISSARYFGQFNPTPLPVGVWADTLCSTLNQNAGAWRNGPVSAILEARVVTWMCELLGYSENSFGTLASGGSEANLIALKCARDAAGENIRDKGLSSTDLTIYASEQCHYSIEKSADILGLGRESVRKISVDNDFHIRLDALGEAIARDRRNGFRPCCIVGVAGATSTGVLDSLGELAGIARENNCWFHVDAAYGGALAFSNKHRHKLRGIELANSITFDPHKWMFVPFACGATLVRDGAKVLREAFDISPDYLAEDRGGADVEFDFFRYGQMGTRRSSALKLWMALQFMGRAGYEEVIDRQIDLTVYLADQIQSLQDFELVSPVETAVCCFRFVPASLVDMNANALDQLQQHLQQVIEKDGEAWLTTTVLNNRRTLRVNINSFLTERRHIEDLIELLERSAAEVLREF